MNDDTKPTINPTVPTAHSDNKPQEQKPEEKK